MGNSEKSILFERPNVLNTQKSKSFQVVNSPVISAKFREQIKSVNNLI
jgi:hypothetical protein